MVTNIMVTMHMHDAHGVTMS